MKFRSIKFIVTMFILIVGAVIILVFGFFSYFNIKTSLEKKYYNEADLVLKHTMISFRDKLDMAENMITLLEYSNTFKKAWISNDYKEVTSYLNTLHKTLPSSKNFKLGLEDGSVCMATNMKVPVSYDSRKQKWYKLAKKNNNTIVWTEPYLDYMTQKIIITAAKTVTDSTGKILGVAAIDFDVSTISEIISNSKIGQNGYVMLLSSNGVVIANRDDYLIGKQILSDDIVNKRVLREKGQIYNYNIDNKSYRILYDSFKRNNMIILTAISKKEINNSLIQAHKPALITGIILLLIFSISAYYLVFKAIFPLEELAFLMKKAENGNYNVYSKVKGYIEVNSISKSFNSMIRGIRRRDRELNDSYKELALTEEKLRCQYNEIERSQRVLKKSEEKIKQLAYYDSLTGLLNRQSLIKRLEKFIKEDKPCAIIYIDLDNFKTINDTLGHTIGDRVLVKVGQKFNKAISHNKIIARIGGDEFIILVQGLISTDDISEVCRDLLDFLQEVVIIDSKRFNLSASVGISMFPLHGNSVEELLKKADTAMYKAKESGKNCYKIFNQRMQSEIIERVNIENGLRKALRNNELELYYQPQYNAINGSIYGIEALLRTNSSSLQNIPTLKIIKIAEEVGLILDIEKWVFKNACKFAKLINKNSNKCINVSINVSVKHIMQNDFVKNIKNIVNQIEVDPNNIGLEITETIMMESFESNKGKLEELKKFGLSVHLDDFGSGYSSLNYLQSLPINYVKIDKIFIDNMINSQRNGKIIASIIKLAHNIGLKVVAEGVENKEQFDLLSKYNCDIIQGYYFSKPLSENEIIKTIDKS